MARDGHEDAVLRNIAREALNFLLKHIDADKIRCILLTGSVANGEGTVIKYNTSMVTSDFDFEIYFGFPHFMKNRAYLQNLSREISARFLKRGVNTHIQFLPSTSLLHMSINFASSSIYEYEFAFASRCIFGKTPSFNKEVRPSKRDALELVFTAISDLVLSKFKDVSKIEESYICAKRALTVLNSALIFHGVFTETYEKRMKIAKEYASKGAIPLNQDEIKVLEIFTEYKLSGSFQHIMDSFGCRNIDDLIRFQREFLRKLTTKILYYGLLVLLDKPMKTNLTYSNSLQNMISEFPELLREYSKNSRVRLPSRIMGIIICLFGLLARNSERKELFATFIFHKQSPKVILNVLITLLLVYGHKVSVTRILRESFPWIDFDNAPAIRRLLSLWRIAEQSIKLG